MRSACDPERPRDPKAAGTEPMSGIDRLLLRVCVSERTGQSSHEIPESLTRLPTALDQQIAIDERSGAALARARREIAFLRRRELQSGEASAHCIRMN